MLTIYLILTTSLTGILSIIWDKKDFLNTFVKIVLMVSTILGTILLLENSGYIIKG